MVNRVVTEINYSLYIQRVGNGAGWRGAPCTGRASNALTVLSRKFSYEQNYLESDDKMEFTFCGH